MAEGAQSSGSGFTGNSPDVSWEGQSSSCRAARFPCPSACFSDNCTFTANYSCARPLLDQRGVSQKELFVNDKSIDSHHCKLSFLSQASYWFLSSTLLRFFSLEKPLLEESWIIGLRILLQLGCFRDTFLQTSWTVAQAVATLRSVCATI